MPEKNLGALLLSAREYARLHHKTPYIYTLEAGDRFLHYVGFAHSNNPAHPSFERLRKDFEWARPTLTLIEGNPAVNELTLEDLQEKTRAFTDNDLIQRLGESAFALKMSVECGCPVQSPEPSGQDMVLAMQQAGYSQEHIFAQYVLTDILQYLRIQNRVPLAEYLAPRLHRLEEHFGWAGFPFSLQHFEEVYQRLTGRGFSLDNEQKLIEIIDPTPWPDLPEYGVLNEISAFHSQMRDNYMVQKIAEIFRTPQRLFIVYGASHAVMQEPSLKALFKSFD
jgi:hypothetical protein